MKLNLPSNIRLLLTLLVTLLINSVAIIAYAAEYAHTPSPRAVEYDWMSIADWNKQHAANIARAKQGNVDLLFLGDSITQGWTWGDNSKIFAQAFGAYTTANFGIGGDQTQHLLWRLHNGKTEKVDPKVTVLMIGVNNFGHSQHSPEEVSKGVKANVNTIKTLFPNSKILLLAIFPYDEKPTSWNRVAVASANQLIAQLADDKHVYYYDLGHLFVNERGVIPKSLMADFLHPTTEGYKKIAQVLKPAIEELMK